MAERIKAIAAWVAVAAFWAGAAVWARRPIGSDDDHRGPDDPPAVSGSAAPGALRPAGSGPAPGASGGPAPALSAEARLPDGRRVVIHADVQPGGHGSPGGDQAYYPTPTPAYDLSYPGAVGSPPVSLIPPPPAEKQEHYSNFEKCLNLKMMFPELRDIQCIPEEESRY